LAIPPIYIYISRTLTARKLKKTGIGKGAPGFLTSVKKVAVTPEIAARLRRGEHVSPEEIAACQNPSAAVSQQSPIVTASPPSTEDAPPKADDSNEWLPEHVKNTPKRKPKSKRK
jgi:hypothetical protein